MKIPSTNIYQQPVATTIKTENQPKDVFSSLLQQTTPKQETPLSQETGPRGPEVVGSKERPRIPQNEAAILRAKRNEMYNLWDGIKSAERQQMHAIESKFGNKMAKDLGLTKPFRLSTSWNEYMTGKPLMVTNADFPTVHPQSDKIREYLDAHLKDVPELSGLINSHTKFMAQYRNLGPEKMFDQWMAQNNFDISDDSIEKMTSMRDQAKSLADRAEAELMASFS